MGACEVVGLEDGEKLIDGAIVDEQVTGSCEPKPFDTDTSTDA